jgi:Fur family transcriptional regulator, ferric uptake regulator
MDDAARERWLEHATRVLSRAGLRASAGRTAVVELLARDGGCLLSAQEIVRALHARGDAGSNATVYRTLETLHGLGLVHRLDRDGVAHYEIAQPSGEHHHHLVDEDTGEIVSFVDAELERVIGELGRRLRVELTGHDVILRGRRVENASQHR